MVITVTTQKTIIWVISKVEDFLCVNISVKFVLIVDNTVYLLKHFNKKGIELELEIQSLTFSTWDS